MQKKKKRKRKTQYTSTISLSLITSFMEMCLKEYDPLPEEINPDIQLEIKEEADRFTEEKVKLFRFIREGVCDTAGFACEDMINQAYRTAHDNAFTQAFRKIFTNQSKQMHIIEYDAMLKMIEQKAEEILTKDPQSEKRFMEVMRQAVKFGANEGTFKGATYATLLMHEIIENEPADEKDESYIVDYFLHLKKQYGGGKLNI